jgi:ketosteroid isomerase-like protein
MSRNIVIVTALAGSLFFGGVRAVANDALQAVEKGWAAAVVKGDIPALEKILADDLIYAHSTGVVESKSEYLGKLKGGAQRYDVIEHQSMTVKVYGDAAVVHSRVRMAGKNVSGPFDHRLMMLHVWVKRGGAWQLAAHQTTRLP